MDLFIIPQKCKEESQLIAQTQSSPIQEPPVTISAQ